MASPGRFERLRRVLNEPPTRFWPTGLLHHGSRVLLLLVTALVVQMVFPAAPVPDFPVFEAGMVPEEDVFAEVPFSIRKSDEDLERERQEAAAGVPPTFSYLPSAADSMTTRVTRFLAHFDTIAAQGVDELRSRARARELLQQYGFVPTDALVEALRSPVDRAILRRSLLESIDSIIPDGVVATAALEQYGAPQLQVRRGDGAQLVPRDQVVTAPAFWEQASAYLPDSRRAALAELQRLVLIRFFEPSLRYAADATESERARASQAVATTKGEVRQGERIIEAHEQVREADLERLRSYRDELAQLGRLESGPTAAPRAIGALLYNLIVLGIFGLLLFFFRQEVYSGFRNVLLVSFLVLLLVGAAGIVGARDWPIELIPIALPALAVAVLWDGRMALILTLILSLLLAGQTPFVGMSVVFTCAVAGSAAALSVRVVRSRAQTWLFAGIIAGAYFAAILALGLLRQHAWSEILTSTLWGAASAIVSALVAMGSLPLFEAFTRITTPQTLLELADLNRPLLQRLRKEAPGTFAHSISVAGMAESAARAIGADALLTRVGLYYHDIGKVIKPQYFIENQHAPRNPHDKLKPATSASIVRNHIIEGMRLAEEHHLPDDVAAFIAEHHGTQAISFFYEQAKKQNPDTELDLANFSYPGPRPRSRETAIAMLADSVESATRVLQDPTPERIRDLVDRIVDGKIQDGQLQETPLTFNDIRLIKEEFVNVLSGMHHQRIDYPPKPKSTPEPAAAASGADSGA